MLDADGVSANGESEKSIESFVIRLHLSDDAGLGVGCGDRSARNEGARGIRDNP